MLKKIFHIFFIFLLKWLPSSGYTATYRDKFIHFTKKSRLDTFKAYGLVTDQSYVTLQGILPLMKRKQLFTWVQWDNYAAFKTIHTRSGLNLIGLGLRRLLSSSWMTGGYLLCSDNPLKLPSEGKIDIGIEGIQLRKKILVHADWYLNIEELSSYEKTQQPLGIGAFLWQTSIKDPMFLSRALLHRGEIQAKHHFHPNIMYTTKLHWSKYKNVPSSWDIAAGMTWLSAWSRYSMNFGLKASFQANWRLNNCYAATKNDEYELETKRLTFHWAIAAYLNVLQDPQDPILRYFNHTADRYFVPAISRKLQFKKAKVLSKTLNNRRSLINMQDHDPE